MTAADSSVTPEVIISLSDTALSNGASVAMPAPFPGDNFAQRNFQITFLQGGAAVTVAFDGNSYSNVNISYYRQPVIKVGTTGTNIVIMLSKSEGFVEGDNYGCVDLHISFDKPVKIGGTTVTDFVIILDGTL